MCVCCKCLCVFINKCLCVCAYNNMTVYLCMCMHTCVYNYILTSMLVKKKKKKKKKECWTFGMVTRSCPVVCDLLAVLWSGLTSS